VEKPYANIAISYIVHQCARFVEKPKESHAKALRWLARYLRATKDKGLILKPDKHKDLEVYVDADFSGNWDPEDAAETLLGQGMTI
jgi:hypothetical protein